MWIEGKRDSFEKKDKLYFDKLALNIGICINLHFDICLWRGGILNYKYKVHFKMLQPKAIW